MRTSTQPDDSQPNPPAAASQNQAASRSAWWQGDDWVAVLIAFGLILLAVLGVIGKNGLVVIF